MRTERLFPREAAFDGPVFEVDTPKDSEFDTFVDVMDTAYLEVTGDRCRKNLGRILDMRKCHCVFERPPQSDSERKMVATLGTYTFDLTVPGGTTAATAITGVAVLPSHRRRGFLRSMLREAEDVARSNRHPLAVLLATEPTIYKRFGYGCAIDTLKFRISSRLAEFVVPPHEVTVKLVDASVFLTEARPVYNSVRVERPGAFGRGAEWWRSRHFVDNPFGRFPGAKLKYALAKRGDEVVGYLLYHTGWRQSGSGTKGQLYARELVGLDLDAETALWQFCIAHDLVDEVIAPYRAMRDPLPHLFMDPRAVEETRSEGLYVRVLDVARALMARRYSCAAKITIRVTDPADIAGFYDLAIDASGGASCHRLDVGTDRASDIELSGLALAEIYMGGRRAIDLANRGLIKGGKSEINTLDQLFLAAETPVSMETF